MIIEVRRLTSHKRQRPGANKQKQKEIPALPADVVSIESILGRIRDLHSKSADPIAEGLQTVQLNAFTFMKKETGDLERKLASIGTDVVAAKRAVDEASSAAQSSSASALEARELVRHASNAVDNIPKVINSTLVEQISATVPVTLETDDGGAKAGTTVMKELKGRALLTYVTNKISAIETARLDERTKPVADTQGPSLEAILTEVDVKLLTPFIKASAQAQENAASLAQQAIDAVGTVNGIIAGFRAELAKRDKVLLDVYTACQGFLGKSLSGVPVLREMIATTMTPAVLNALGEDNYKEQISALATNSGVEIVRSILKGFATSEETMKTALAAEYLSAGIDLEDPANGSQKAHFDATWPMLQRKATECLALLQEPKPVDSKESV